MLFYSIQATHNFAHLTHRFERFSYSVATTPQIAVITNFKITNVAVLTKVEGVTVCVRQC